MKIINKTKNRICTIRELEPTDVCLFDGEIYMVTTYRFEDECAIVSLETGYRLVTRPDNVVYKLDAELIVS